MNLKLVSATLAFTFFTINAYAQTFTRKADMEAGSYSHAATVVNGKIYVFGGSNKTALLSTVQMYDPATNIWVTKQPIPNAVCEIVVGTVNGKIYVIGGYDGNATNRVQEYDPQANTWTQKATMPTSRSVLSGSVINGKIYVTCGWSGSYKQTEVYDPATDTWASKTDAPYGILQINSGAAVGTDMFIIGGRDYGKAIYYDYNMCYNSVTNTWSLKAPLPLGLFAGCVAGRQGKLHYFGGSNDLEYNMPTKSHYIYNPVANTWSSGLQFPEKISGAAAVAIGNDIYIMGGLDSTLKASNRVWKYGDTITTAIKEPASRVAISLFPNPAGNTLNVQLSNRTQTGVISIYDMRGSLMRTITVDTDAATISLDKVPAGQYMLHYNDQYNNTVLQFTRL
jgi:N-acetylneuraminic acid mutarotase